MSTGNRPNRPLRKGEVVLREHAWDGIQEYDQRLPNWWLYTLYGAIAFAFFYWLILFQFEDGDRDVRQLNDAIATIEAKNLAAIETLDDASIWQMSRNDSFVASGAEIYSANCVACHGANLEGGIGLPLADAEWKHGGTPLQVYNVVFNGSPDQTAGMAPWGPALGPAKVAQVTAFVMSHHTQP
ncbi:MAG: cbb3-type cytochrome c oxidase N-terminal domain-containing protein [Opitutales bacterium]